MVSVEREVFLQAGVGTVPVDARMTQIAPPFRQLGRRSLKNGSITALYRARRPFPPPPISSHLGFRSRVSGSLRSGGLRRAFDLRADLPPPPHHCELDATPTQLSFTWCATITQPRLADGHAKSRPVSGALTHSAFVVGDFLCHSRRRQHS